MTKDSRSVFPHDQTSARPTLSIHPSDKSQTQDFQAVDQDDMEFAEEGLRNLNFVEDSDDRNVHTSAPITSPTLSSAGSVTSATETPKTESKFKTALGDIRHFAGGLVSHPYESTKHYSILRHSHGLVFYSGSYTNLAITIFADCELPPDRSLWIQRKGWSGKTGLKAGVFFGSKGAWINVTPTINATSDQLKPSDERAWQRDIKKFLDKAPKGARNHEARETNVLRIPCHADDGYMRVVLCAGQKGKQVLCPSPIFRLASTSTDSSSLRGASLMTLPLEASVKIASFVGRSAATTALAPAATTAQIYAAGQLSQVYQPSAVTQIAAKQAYNASGIEDRIANGNDKYNMSRQTSSADMGQEAFDALSRGAIIGDESGPSEPFPVRFSGEVIQGRGESISMLGLPSANLEGIPRDILLKYDGFFFGWAAVTLNKKLKADNKTKYLSEDWHEAVISIAPIIEAKANVVQKKVVRVYIIHDFGEAAQFVSAKLSLMLMGFLRPVSQTEEPQSPLGPQLQSNSLPSSPSSSLFGDPSQSLFDLYKDIAVATASLSRPAWTAESTLELVKTRSSNRSFTEKYVDFRQSGQNKFDQIMPVHKVGVRTNNYSHADRLVGNGGIRVPR